MRRKKLEQHQKHRKWKYADFAKKRRHCERCIRTLTKDEAGICHTCYIELLAGNTREVYR